jgi:hypothetical protein
LAPESPVGVSVEVHCGQRVAWSGMLEQQNGQSFLGSGGASGLLWSLLIVRTHIKIVKLTIKNEITVFKKTP